MIIPKWHCKDIAKIQDQFCLKQTSKRYSREEHIHVHWRLNWLNKTETRESQERIQTSISLFWCWWIITICIINLSAISNMFFKKSEPWKINIGREKVKQNAAASNGTHVLLKMKHNFVPLPSSVCTLQHNLILVPLSWPSVVLNLFREKKIR